MYPISHAASPCAELPVSAEHAVQDPFTIINPALHLHSALPGTESALAPHTLHCISEGAPSSDVTIINPALHLHSALPGTESALATHTLHFISEGAPSSDEYFPLAQDSQSSAEVAAHTLEYFPCGHA